MDSDKQVWQSVPKIFFVQQGESVQTFGTVITVFESQSALGPNCEVQ